MEVGMTTICNPWGYAAEWTEGIPPEIHMADADVLTMLLNKVRSKGMAVLEVGSWVGNGSTRVIVELIRKFNGILYCVDTFAGSDNVKHHLQYRAEYNNMFHVFSQNVRKYNGQDIVRPVILPSLDASRKFPDESLDLVFIDGSHGYTHVKQDIRAWLPKVKEGGILCGHDCDACFQDIPLDLRSEVIRQCEEDVIDNIDCPRLPIFHGGVVVAVDEIFGTKANLWFKSRPTTIWSYQKPGGMLRKFRAFLRQHTPWFQRRDPAAPVPQQ
jgi:hypothetical protein